MQFKWDLAESAASRGSFQGGNLSYQRNLMLIPVDSDWMFIARNLISHWLHTRTLLIYCFNHLQITVFWWACSFTNDMGSRSHEGKVKSACSHLSPQHPQGKSSLNHHFWWLNTYFRDYITNYLRLGHHLWCFTTFDADTLFFVFDG